MSNVSFEVALGILPANEPAAGDWTDLTARLTEPVQTLRDGATVILSDDDRTLDPTVGGSGRLVRHCRLIGHANSLDLPMWRGLTDTWTPRLQNGKAVMKVSQVDGLAWCALQDYDVDLPQQYSHERIAALLDLAGWPAGLRDIGTGKVLLEPVEQAGANIVRQIEDAVDAEQGRLWVDPSGQVAFRGRHDLLDLTVAATIGDGGLPLVDGIEPQHDTFRLTNRARVEMADGTTYTIEDATAQGQHGPRTESPRDLALPWYEANGLADWIVTRFKDPHTWLSGVQVDVATEDDLQTVLGLDVADRVTFKATVRGVQDTVDCLIESITHDVVAGGWTTTFDLSPYFGQGPWLTTDDPVTGLLDGTNRAAP